MYCGVRLHWNFEGGGMGIRAWTSTDRSCKWVPGEGSNGGRAPVSDDEAQRLRDHLDRPEIEAPWFAIPGSPAQELEPHQ